MSSSEAAANILLLDHTAGVAEPWEILFFSSTRPCAWERGEEKESGKLLNVGALTLGRPVVVGEEEPAPLVEVGDLPRAMYPHSPLPPQVSSGKPGQESLHSLTSERVDLAGSTLLHQQLFPFTIANENPLQVSWQRPSDCHVSKAFKGHRCQQEHTTMAAG